MDNAFSINWQVAIWGIGIIFLGGIAYGDIRSRVSKIEKLLYNNSFLTKAEARALLDSANREHEQIRKDIDALDKRIYEIKGQLSHE